MSSVIEGCLGLPICKMGRRAPGRPRLLAELSQSGVADKGLLHLKRDPPGSRGGSLLGVFGY